MENDKVNYWQISCGDDTRNFAEIFKKFGVVCIGNGDYGKYNKEKYDKLLKEKCNEIDKRSEINEEEKEKMKKKIEQYLEQIKRFAIEIKKEDKIICWIQVTNATFRLGKVISEYKYTDKFGDLDGWDMQHYREVRWIFVENYKDKIDCKEDTTDFKNSILARNWFCKVDKEEVKKKADEIWEKGGKNEIICNIDEVKETEINTYTFFNTTFDLSKWYYDKYKLHFWDLGTPLIPFPSEAEMIAHLIIPFFKTLGYHEKQISIEVNKVDMIVYNNEGRENQDAKILIEAKVMNSGKEGAEKQVIGYADSDDYKDVKYLIVTDGIKYHLYERNASNWKNTAYINFHSFSDNYTLKEKHCCLENVEGASYFFDKVKNQ